MIRLTPRWSLLGGALALLLLLFVWRLVATWGLITIHVTDAPLATVIRSIERQAWVRVYTEIDPQTKITLSVDQVTLPEAMETLAANCGEGGGAQWKLAYFIGATPTGAMNAVRAFQNGDRGNEWKIYSYQTPLSQMVGDAEAPAADPYLYAWGGMKPSYLEDPRGPFSPVNGTGAEAASAAPPGPESVTGQTYLRAFALGCDIFIMSASDWQPAAPLPPAANPSIRQAVKSFVSAARGYYVEALVLRQGGRRGNGPRGERPPGGGDRADFNIDWTATADRLYAAVETLPPEVREPARQSIAEEVDFRNSLTAVPEEQRRKLMMEHQIKKRTYGNNNWRRSPEKRAQGYKRMVNNKIAARSGNP